MIVFGGIRLDFVFPVGRLPDVGDTVISRDSRMQPGGKGLNQAIAAARDGAEVALIGTVGDDPLADIALVRLRDAGVDVGAVRRTSGQTGRSAILVDPAGHTMVSTDVGAAEAAQAAQIDDRLLDPGRLLLLQLEADPTETARVIARARARRMRIVLNLSPARVIETSALRSVDLLVGNSLEMAWLGEQIGTANNPASLQAALGVAVVRMMGVQGADGMTPDGFLRMPAHPVEMRDTTAAADCFTGVLAAALQRGESLSTALRRAAVAAALSTTRIGAQEAMPSRSEIDAALADAPQVMTTEPEVPE